MYGSFVFPPPPQKSAKITPCAMCKSLRSSAEMIESTNNVGKTELFCSVNCLSAHRVKVVTSSGIHINFSLISYMFRKQREKPVLINSLSFLCTCCFIYFLSQVSRSNVIAVKPQPSLSIILRCQMEAYVIFAAIAVWWLFRYILNHSLVSLLWLHHSEYMWVRGGGMLRGFVRREPSHIFCPTAHTLWGEKSTCGFNSQGSCWSCPC